MCMAHIFFIEEIDVCRDMRHESVYVCVSDETFRGYLEVFTMCSDIQVVNAQLLSYFHQCHLQ